MHKLLKIYSVITSIGMLIVLLQGALVTKTGSGEGCGATWPLCFGELIPTSPAIETIIEYSHRIVSGLLGIMVIILAIWTWRKLSHVRETKFMAIMAILFIMFQGFLGAGAVVWGQSHAVLALHFGISAISFATVVLLTVLVFEDGKRNVPAPVVSKGFKYYAIFVITYCYIVIYTGAYVKHTNATLACTGFPLCNGEVLPELSGPVGAHFSHRVFGTLLLIFIFILFILVLRNYRHSKVLVWSSSLALLFVIAQLVSGISIIFLGNTLTVSLLHALIISLLFASLSYLTMVILRK
ncbi:COX15/CtaA family protein [Desertibacillus haloalkaliphilus]|uniref:COX15/CtaA family protein n=1 Tax=Desertibacillus haloalkaliphilus TaxID=1328930 RepID=UPI001C27534D|nr:heme A synthase [Desertibacillus haloalkaliphilus]MBU8907157.1 heme A synthase [Desertibacillus haloalkaliphilus]